MLQKLLQWFGTKFFPYWCPYDTSRYHTEAKFHDHYMKCQGRLAAEAREREALGAIAPMNRSQKRKMAKKAGQIKNWGELNAP